MILNSLFAFFNSEQRTKLSIMQTVLTWFRATKPAEDKYRSFTINVHAKADETYYPPQKYQDSTYRALRLNKLHTNIDLEHITREELAYYVRKTNSAPFQCSGNCELLSDILMYNLLNQEGYFLSAQNTYPVWKPAGSIQRQLFGQYIGSSYDSTVDEAQTDSTKEKSSRTSKSIDQLERRILACHRRTNEVLFKVTGWRHVPLVGTIGHCFNAIILKDEHGQPSVQFLDAWLSNPLPSKNYLSNKYKPGHSELQFTYVPDKTLMSQMSFESTSNGVEVRALGEIYKPGRRK